MLGSLERIGGTPAILWGLGVARKGKHGPAALKAMTGELSRRGRDLVPRRGRARRDPGRSRVATRCSRATRTWCPGPGYAPNGEDRAWGRRWRSASGSNRHFDDRGSASRSRVASRPACRFSTPARSRRPAARRSCRSSASSTQPGQGDDRLRVGGGRRAGRRFLRSGLLTASLASARRRSGAGALRRVVTGCRHALCSHTYAVGARG